MKNKKILAGLTTAAVAFPMFTFSISPTLASTTIDDGQKGNSTERVLSPELLQLREAIKKAIESRDYSTWRSLMEKRTCNPDPVDVVNASNFSKFAEMKKLMEEKQYDKADAIRKELGLCSPGGKKWNKLMKKLNQIDKTTPGLGKMMRYKHLSKLGITSGSTEAGQ